MNCVRYVTPNSEFGKVSWPVCIPNVCRKLKLREVNSDVIIDISAWIRSGDVPTKKRSTRAYRVWSVGIKIVCSCASGVMGTVYMLWLEQQP